MYVEAAELLGGFFDSSDSISHKGLHIIHKLAESL